VCGKVPAKFAGEHSEWTFVKAEHFGTQQTMDTIGHTGQLVKTVAGVSKGDAALRGKGRKEKPAKKAVQAFCAIAKLTYEVPERVWATELYYEEVVDRAKHVGMSFMYENAKRIARGATALLAKWRAEPPAEEGGEEKLAKVTALQQQATAYVQSIDANPEIDHLNIRFGDEVILDLAELDIDEDE
jgi:hypothetical protein